jgi:hypothetical protein
MLFLPNSDKYSRNVAFRPTLQHEESCGQQEARVTLPIAGPQAKWVPRSSLCPQTTGQKFYAALRPTAPFLLRSAHLFFIISDNRFLPSTVRWRLFFALRMIKLGSALFTERFLAPSVPSSAAMARLRRSLSLFNSDTIAPRSTIPPLVFFCFGLSFPQMGLPLSHELGAIAN